MLKYSFSLIIPGCSKIVTHLCTKQLIKILLHSVTFAMLEVLCLTVCSIISQLQSSRSVKCGLSSLLVFPEETEYLVDLSLNIGRKQQAKKVWLSQKIFVTNLIRGYTLSFSLGSVWSSVWSGMADLHCTVKIWLSYPTCIFCIYSNGQSVMLIDWLINTFHLG